MAKGSSNPTKLKKPKVHRKGIHSKNAPKKKKYRGQGQ